MEKFLWRLFAIVLFVCNIWSLMFLFVVQNPVSVSFWVLAMIGDWLYVRFEPTWL